MDSCRHLSADTCMDLNHDAKQREVRCFDKWMTQLAHPSVRMLATRWAPDRTGALDVSLLSLGLSGSEDEDEQPPFFAHGYRDRDGDGRARDASNGQRVNALRRYFWSSGRTRPPNPQQPRLLYIHLYRGRDGEAPQGDALGEDVPESADELDEDIGSAPDSANSAIGVRNDDALDNPALEALPSSGSDARRWFGLRHTRFGPPRRRAPRYMYISLGARRGARLEEAVDDDPTTPELVANSADAMVPRPPTAPRPTPAAGGRGWRIANV